jgi:hypothetical protein
VGFYADNKTLFRYTDCLEETMIKDEIAKFAQMFSLTARESEVLEHLVINTEKFKELAAQLNLKRFLRKRILIVNQN